MEQNKYEKGLIYIISCKEPEIKEIYVGSTINFRSRKSHHRTDCHNKESKNYNSPVYQFIRSNGGIYNWQFIELEQYKAKDLRDLQKRERECLDKLRSEFPVLNKLNPSRTKEEKKEQYLKCMSKPEIQAQRKEYFNKPEIKERRKEYDKLPEVIERRNQPEYKERVKEIKIKSYEKHKEKYKVKASEKYTCEICNKELTCAKRKRHEQTKTHLSLASLTSHPEEP